MRSRVFVAALLLLSLGVTDPAGAEDRPAKPAETTSPADATPPADTTQPAKPAQPAEPTLRRRAGTEDAAAKARAELDQEIRRIRQVPAPKSLDDALRRLGHVRTSVDWKDIPLADAVSYIGRLAGFNVIVGPALQADGLDGIEPLTLKLTDVSLKTLSGLVARLTGTKLAVVDRILLFTTPVEARGKPVLRIHALGDLTVVLRNFPGPDINLRSSGAEFEPEEESVVETGLSDPDKIADMLREFVAADTWDDAGVSMTADRRRLIIRQYPEVQRKIARFLMILRAAR